ncbi:hypothetical protein MRB53_037707 [Persea americana]|nr:hypothetical protein MRB53_037707 [Persea americana]
MSVGWWSNSVRIDEQGAALERRTCSRAKMEASTAWQASRVKGRAWSTWLAILSACREQLELSETSDSDADEDEDPASSTTRPAKKITPQINGSILDVDFSKASLFQEMHARDRNPVENDTFMSDDNHVNGFPRASTKPRRFTLPASRATTVLNPGKAVKKKHKRSRLSWYLRLNATQVDRRKIAYAVYVYLAVIVIILGPVRRYVGIKALMEDEPIGWAISYLFGQLTPVRELVSFLSIDSWIHLPPSAFDIALSMPTSLPLDLPLIREAVGASNVRLILIAYWVLVLSAGLVAVFTLTPYVRS